MLASSVCTSSDWPSSYQRRYPGRSYPGWWGAEFSSLRGNSKRQVQRIVGAGPAAHRLADASNDGQLMGVGARRQSGQPSRGAEARLEASPLATATHLPSVDEEGEGGGACLWRWEAGFGEDVAGRPCRTLTRPRGRRAGTLD